MYISETDTEYPETETEYPETEIEQEEVEVIEVEQPEQKNPFVEETTVSTTQWPTWTPDDNDYNSGDYNPGQWEWSPSTSEKPAPCDPGSYDLVPGECNAFLTCTTNGVAQKSYCKVIFLGIFMKFFRLFFFNYFFIFFLN